ncbi:hypothetical protein AX16_009472 [Volvariella volvacea WC 439]|nr:hypothetical protein AX16_009472 [Volvariella volvacea WC 439]
MLQSLSKQAARSGRAQLSSSRTAPASLHTSSVLLKQRQRSSSRHDFAPARPSGGRKLADDLSASSRKNRVEVAAPARGREQSRERRVFSREELPHLSKPERRSSVSFSTPIFHRNEARPRRSDTSPPPERERSLFFEPGTLVDEFDHPTSLEPTPGENDPATSTSLPTRFTSPPLLPGFVESLTDTFGPNARPTPIQALSIKHLIAGNKPNTSTSEKEWKQYLLASETGSGKSIAYLLPVLQALKEAELSSTQEPSGPSPTTHVHAPRAIVLAPTHELSRQLSGFAKNLLHNVKLRVLCASRANTKNRENEGMGMGQHSVDVLVGTPVRLMEMIRGRDWDWERATEREKRLDAREREMDPWELASESEKNKSKSAGAGKTGHSAISLKNVEWVVVDEADILFDPDFQETTLQLLADISAARGTPITLSSSSPSSPSSPTRPIHYPFNLVLTSATIPTSLSTYLKSSHPNLIRLASPRLHRLPKTLKIEYEGWTHGAGGSGNGKWRDIERKIREVWRDDVYQTAVGGPAGAGAGAASPNTSTPLSKVLVFVNKGTKVEDLGAYLEERGIRNVALTGKSEERKRGSNRHLEGFLRVRPGKRDKYRTSKLSPIAEDDEVSSPASSASSPKPTSSSAPNDPKQTPHVLITTSLLSRGLDFSPDIKNVFIVDEPRNMIDFLHRAGRTARMGERGRVVLFGKMKGRGSGRNEDVRRRVGVLGGPGGLSAARRY